ncbi:MAG: peptidoglycan DD-metalloendopeptidase family protein [Brevefilum sp.]|nr:peptidoglycan DD-metalloendopeptidase family protein [Brevefilum sp.]MDT8380974.1 peptidoglycan DD-metalloendopeptidase family protein [Brevefilum sp.]
MQEKNNPWFRQEQISPEETVSQTIEPEQTTEPMIKRTWEALRRIGLGDSTLRFATLVTTVLLILLVVWVMDAFYLDISQLENESFSAVNAANLPNPTTPPQVPLFKVGGSDAVGVSRKADLYTVLPVRNARYEVVEYTVESGDSIFSIADKFNLNPETILWGNRYTLGDDPHFILPGQTLNILPVDGVYHMWSAGEGLNGVASFYGVSPEDIVNWPGNNLNPDEIGDYANPKIPPDTMLVIPGGQGTYTDWRTPRISREEPATAQHLGPGACTTSYDGITGSLVFMWPSTERYLSGFDYSPETNHFAVDIAGQQGNPIFAADHGVVVYAGWNDYGYGEMIVIDHGSGWQTLYAHLSQINVSCGQEVMKGDTIGLMGSTGKSTGPHLHLEMRSDEFGRVNPWNFLN